MNMSQYAQMIRQLKTPEVMKRLNTLYGQREGMMVAQTTRYTALLKRHEDLFNTSGPVYMISAPGRTEISGNHTDHNRGKVLTAAVNLDTVAAVSPREDGVVNVHSEGYPAISISLDDLAAREDEKNTTAALIRGVAYKLQEEGYKIGGFDAAVTSTVRGGSGLSSSAAFEVMLCAIFDELYNQGTLDYKHRAKISQFAENVYFGKPSGLLDQMASSTGGLAYIDFQNDDPQVKPMNYDFSKKGYSLVVVNTGGSHDDLTADYASIPAEMKAVARVFGQEVLRQVQPERFFLSLPVVREKLDVPNVDRALLRATHFFDENRRVSDQVTALQEDNLEDFLRLVIESGRAVTLEIDGQSVNAADLRLALGSTKMRSTLLTSLKIENGKVHMAGKGYGHGVGMSQWGAYGMAQEDKSAEQIIKHYFQKVEIAQIGN